MAVLFVLLWSSHDYEQLFRETCMAVPRHQLLQILDDYEQSRGNGSILSYLHNVRIIFGTVMVAMTIAEITIYFVFFYHMYQDDNHGRISRLLEPHSIKLRNKNNAITFFGQFCSFMFELSFGIVIVWISAKQNSYERTDPLYLLMFVLKTVCFTSMSAVEVLTSSQLRPRIFKW